MRFGARLIRCSDCLCITREKICRQTETQARLGDTSTMIYIINEYIYIGALVCAQAIVLRPWRLTSACVCMHYALSVYVREQVYGSGLSDTSLPTCCSVRDVGRCAEHPEALSSTKFCLIHLPASDLLNSCVVQHCLIALPSNICVGQVLRW